LDFIEGAEKLCVHEIEFPPSLLCKQTVGTNVHKILLGERGGKLGKKMMLLKVTDQ
jgi:hypothetical protein